MYSVWNKKLVSLFSSVPLSSCALCSGQRAGSGHLLPQEEEDDGLGAAVRQPRHGRLPLLHLLLPALHPVLLQPRLAGRKHHVHLLRPWLLHLRPVRYVHHHRHQHPPVHEDVLQFSLRWGCYWFIGEGWSHFHHAWGDVDKALKERNARADKRLLFSRTVFIDCNSTNNPSIHLLPVWAYPLE